METLLIILGAVLAYPLLGGLTLGLCSMLPPRRNFSDGEGCIIVLFWPFMLTLVFIGALAGVGLRISRLFRPGSAGGAR